MRRGLTRAALVLLSASVALLPAGAWGAERKRPGTCISGNCTDGVGTLQLGHATYTGPWSNSWFTAGTYGVVYAVYPAQSHELTIDAQGYPLSGTTHRGYKGDTLRDPSLYTGTYAKVWNPFDRKQVPRYAQGRYVDASGVAYEGDFDFVPGLINTLAGGYYIFQGVRIDEALDEVTPGLYISDFTTADVRVAEFPSILPVVFHRARPDYIAKLHDDLRADLARVNAEEAAKLAQERASRENWNSLFATALGVAAVVGTVKLASRSSASPSTVNALGDTLAGKQNVPSANQKMVSDLRERAKSDPALARRIGRASDAEVAAMLQQAGRTAPQKMTMAEYRSASARPADSAPAAGERRASMVAALDKPAADRAATEKAATEKAASEKAATEKAAADKAAREKERADKEARDRAERERQKAEAEAAKKAERAAQEQAKREYLVALAAGTRLAARTCPGGEGQYYVVGLVPKLKRPEAVSCVDLHYRAQCEGSAVPIDGVGKTFLGAATDCFMGDTYKIEPKPACPLNQLRVTVREMRACGE